MSVRVFLLLPLAACTGELLASDSRWSRLAREQAAAAEAAANAPQAEAGAPGGAVFDASKCALPPPRIVRLSKVELERSIGDLLGTTRALGLPADATFLGFSQNAGALVTPPFGNALKTAAEQLAADFRAAVTASQFGTNCFANDTNARICATTFIDSYAKKAFRRPLTQADVDALLAVYDVGRNTGIDGNAQDRFRSGVDYTLRAILQSPHFLYRTELGDAAGNLTAHELASALSYLLAASPPDAALMTAAESGALASAEGIDVQARRLLSLADGPKQKLGRFVREWLGIDFTVEAWSKSTAVYPQFTQAMKSAVDQETTLLTEDWAQNDATLTALLTSNTTYVSAANAAIYGVQGASATPTKTTLDPAQRSGILTMAGFLATRAHKDSSAPILRGISVVRSVMCGTIPPPPPNVPQLPPVSDTTFATTRDRVAQHTAAPSCAGCHDRINPLGYPFESYDGLGAFRTTENGAPVDPSGAIVGTKTDKPVANAIELSRALVESQEVQACFARQLFRYSFGRQDAIEDECTVRDAITTYRAAGLDAREALIAFVKSTTFRQRLVAP